MGQEDQISYSIVMLIYEEKSNGDVTDILAERTLFRSSLLPDVKGLFKASTRLIHKTITHYSNPRT